MATWFCAQPAARPAAARSLRLERLEERLPLAGVAVDVQRAGATAPRYVSIQGSADSDVISVSQTATQLIIKDGPAVVRRVPLPVARLWIHGREGDDQIRLAPSVTAAATILGGDGNDRLDGLGKGARIFYGGPGDDQMSLGSSLATVFGSGGHDTIIRGTGPYQLQLEGMADSLEELELTIRGSFRGSGATGTFSVAMALTVDAAGSVGGTMSGSGSGSASRGGCTGQFGFTVDGTAGGTLDSIAVSGDVTGSGRGRCGSLTRNFSFSGGYGGTLDPLSGLMNGSWQVSSSIGLVSGNWNAQGARVRRNETQSLDPDAFGGDRPDHATAAQQAAAAILALDPADVDLRSTSGLSVQEQLESLSLGIPVFGVMGNVNFPSPQAVDLLMLLSGQFSQFGISEINGAVHSQASRHRAGRGIDLVGDLLEIGQVEPLNMGSVSDRSLAIQRFFELGAFSPTTGEASYELGVGSDVDRVTVSSDLVAFFQGLGGTASASFNPKTKERQVSVELNGDTYRFRIVLDGPGHLHIGLPQ